MAVWTSLERLLYGDVVLLDIFKVSLFTAEGKVWCVYVQELGASKRAVRAWPVILLTLYTSQWEG